MTSNPDQQQLVRGPERAAPGRRSWFAALMGSTALALASTPGTAHADCQPVIANIWSCSGQETVGQVINQDNAQVTALDGFGVDAGATTALTITGAGSINYQDASGANLRGGIHGLAINATGDAGIVPGRISVVAAGDIHGVSSGINARNDGTGETIITASGTVTGTNESGIYVKNAATATDLTIEAAVVSGGTHGIDVWNLGTGVTSINAGTVTGTTERGINAFNEVEATDLTIDVETVTGRTDGIFATNFGTGATSITATGTATGTSGTGLDAYNAATATDLTISAADVAGGRYGILALNAGTGSTLITSSGTVAGRYGIVAFNDVTTTANAADDGLLVDVQDVTGAETGIAVANSGAGVTRILAGDVTSGIDGFGIIATNGIVDGNAFLTNPTTGLFGEANANATDLVIETGSVTAGIGIYSINDGTGSTSITAKDAVTGMRAVGIYANNAATATDLTISAADVTGGVYGIATENGGTGSTLITSSGTVGGQYGIVAINGVTTTANAAGDGLLVDVQDVGGAEIGIAVANSGAGVTRILAGDVTSGTDGVGIIAANGIVDGNAFLTNPITGLFGEANANATDLVIETGSVTAGIGIYSVNEGTGSTSITAKDTVTGMRAAGIYAENAATANDLSISAADVASSGYGIAADNGGTGSTLIISSGTVTGRYGIVALNDVTTTANAADDGLLVDVQDVGGAEFGIAVANRGAGVTRILAGDVTTGTDGAGIIAANGIVDGNAFLTNPIAGLFGEANANATDIVIETGSVTAGFGIYSINDGTGSTSITSKDTVTGTRANGFGIYAENAATADDLAISAADVTASGYGIVADNGGTGSTLIISSGTVTGRYGIVALNDVTTTADAAGEGLLVDVQDVGGAEVGIAVANRGAGVTRILAGDITTGTDGAGIIAANGIVDGNAFLTNPTTGLAGEANANATDLIVEAGSVSGGIAGIIATNEGTGATSVIANGPVTATGGAGIGVVNESTATDLAIEAGDVSGVGGIVSANYGTGATSITATGTVTGTGEFGINGLNAATATDLTVVASNVSGVTAGIKAVNLGTGATRITSDGLVEGVDAAVTAASVAGNAVTVHNLAGGTLRNRSGASTDLAVVGQGGAVTLVNDSSIVGTVSLDGVVSRFENNGMWNSAGGTSDFSGGVGSEVVNAAGASVVGGSDGESNEMTLLANLPRFTTHGAVTLVDGGAGDVMRVSGAADFSAGSALSLDIGGAGGTDVFVADGAVVLTGATLNLNRVGGLAYGTRYNVLTAHGGLTGTFDTTTGLPAPTAFLAVEDGYDVNNAWI